jgi:hypothetical protein
VKLQVRLQREFGIELPLVELFQRTTVHAQAERLAATTTDDAALQRKFARELPLVELFQRTTVAAQAERLAAPTAPNAALQRARERAARQVTADPTTT